MSAIWGYISYGKHNSIIEKMIIPYEKKCKIDRFSTIYEESVYMGCGIQHITKEAESENLPIVDKSNDFILNADAILDNREELLKMLNMDKTSTDGAIIHRAYVEYGIDFVKHLRGLFSIAIYEKKTGKLTLIADHTASRCLYYRVSTEGVYFSTLIASILEVNEGIEFNENYLKDYLTAPGLMPNVVSEETPYEGIYKLNNGTYIEIIDGKKTEHQYWSPKEKVGDYKCRTAEEYGKYFVKLYSDCVEDALRTDGEIGVSMSSGFDSATVGALAAVSLAKENRNLHTYTYVPYGKAEVHKAPNNVMDETEDVKSIGAMYPNMIQKFLCNKGEDCIQSIPEELEIMEIPFKAFVNLPNLREIYNEAHEDGCKVLLTGQCGNSTVSHGYIDDVLCDLYLKKHYITFLKDLNRYSSTVKESRKKALKGCIGYFNYAREVCENREFDYSPTNEFLKKEILNGYPMEERYVKSQNDLMVRVPNTQKLYQDNLYKRALFTYMGELETKMGLRYGIVIRDATKDMRMLSFCYNLPYHLFAYGGMPRWLIRYNMYNYLPSKIMDNWLRYSVQNADYLDRIFINWEQVKTQLKESLKSRHIDEWVDKEMLRSFLETVDYDQVISGYAEFDDSIYIYIISLLLTEN